MLHLLQSAAPPFFAAILGGFTLFVTLFWIAQREEMVFGWLALIGAAFFSHNLILLQGGPRYLPLIVLPFAFAGFTASFASISGEGRVTMLMRRLGDYLRFGAPGAPPAQRRVIVGAAALSIIGIAHDVFANHFARFNLLPYIGLAVFATLAHLLALRVLDALSVVENLNVILENRARAANASLAASEAARRALEVNGAISKERDRLMREIHDGIGSSLVTALAASERGGHAVDGPALLKRALTDLRIAVDSLEPVQGDIATLMASLRYRVEPDLKKAGISFDWKVEPVPEVDWLDAVNALHVLRIFQEAISNIVHHAEATRITVRCFTQERGGRQGVHIEVADNGKGYEAKGGPRGHGLKNMTSRAEALAAELSQSSEVGRGSSVALWLPVSKSED